jgi:uncharacterized membrane protein HdeD (DUF308 family)
MADTVAGVKASKGWGWLLAGGVATTLIGMFLLVYPAAATAGVTLFLGWTMLIVGIVGFIGAIVNRADGGMWTGMILGLLTAVAGGFFAFNVLAGVLTLTMLFTIWLLVDGAVGIVASIFRRGTGWGWWFTSSLLSLVLGIMLLNAWPSSAIWLLGVYAGITFVFRGLMLTFVSFEVRRLGKA